MDARLAFPFRGATAPASPARLFAVLIAGLALAFCLMPPSPAFADNEAEADGASNAAQAAETTSEEEPSAEAGAQGDGTASPGSVVRAGSVKPNASGSASSDASTSGNSKAGATSILDAANAAGKAAEALADAATPLDAQGNVIDEGQLADNSFLYDAQIGDLASADSYYDNQTVQVEGEVVGDAIAASGEGGRYWIVLRDPETGDTVSVIIPGEDLGKIDTFGRYGATGSILRVKGTYYLDDPEQQGESDIHASQVVLVSPGRLNPDDFDIHALKWPFAAIVLGAALSMLHWYLRERNR